jgi:phospholipase/lecithinase/hemolysin
VLHAQAYTNIVVFGDSLSDTGNFAHLSNASYSYLIPGPVADYTAGRFTDGSDTSPAAQMYTGVWIEQLAAMLAAKPAVKDSLDGGTNYAYGSATNSPGTQVVMYGPGNALTVTINNVGQQIASYLATHPTINSNTLFVVWCGANDLLQATSSAQIVTAGQTDIANVQTLINAGATNIIIPNLPPLGAIPRLNQTGAGALQATGAAAAYNQVIASGIAGLPAANPTKTLHLYALDTYSLFNTILVAPTSVFGLVNVTNSSQGLSTVNPDTYLFWDDLHPTTAVHHLVGLAAKNLLTETATSTTALTLGTANAYPGQNVSLKAVVTPTTGSTPIPTGTVTFYNGSTPIVTTVLDNTGTATASFPAPTASTTPYSITAYYSDDPVYATSTSSAQNLTVLATPVATATTVASSSLAVNLNASVTFTATVSSAVGPPSGSVKFMDGTNLLSTATLAGTTASTATYTTTALAAGTHSITAVYVAGTTWAASTSTAISEVVTAPAYTFTATPASLTTPAGSTASTALTLTPVGGFTGSFTLACGTLPANASCLFAPSTLAATGNNVAASGSLTIDTSHTSYSSLAEPSLPGSHGNLIAFAALLPCCGGLALLTRRRRQLRSLWLSAALVLSFGGAVLGLTGCGSSSTPQNTPTGTYQVPVTLSAGGAVVNTITITLVVQ